MGPDLNRLRHAWQRPKTIIVHEPWWTATARDADIVLPVTTSLERSARGRRQAAKHSRPTLSTRKLAGSAMARWCASSTRVAPGSLAS